MAEVSSELIYEVLKAVQARLAQVDGKADAVAFPQPAERAARERFRAHVADAGSRADTGKTGIGNQRHLPTERQELQRGGELIGFLHPRAHRPAARQHQHLSGLDGTVLDRRHGLMLGGEKPDRSLEAVNAIRIHHPGIDGRAFDDRPFRAEVAF